MILLVGGHEINGLKWWKGSNGGQEQAAAAVIKRLWVTVEGSC